MIDAGVKVHAKKDTNLVEARSAIARARVLAKVRATMLAVGFAELLFASFAVGALCGPAPLSIFELLFGFTAATLIGATLALFVAAVRVDRGAKLRGHVVEGRHRRSIALFEDHLVIGKEIVLFSSISSAELEGSALVLRYTDPEYEGAVLRELVGERRLLSEIQEAARSHSAIGEGASSAPGGSTDAGSNEATESGSGRIPDRGSGTGDRA